MDAVSARSFKLRHIADCIGLHSQRGHILSVADNDLGSMCSSAASMVSYTDSVWPDTHHLSFRARLKPTMYRASDFQFLRTRSGHVLQSTTATRQNISRYALAAPVGEGCNALFSLPLAS